MKRVCSTLLLLTLFTLGVVTGAAAQQVVTGQNFNVNPGVVDQYVGDKYLQRQVEPKIVCASNNTQLCLGIANDYRTVDMIADSSTGFGEAKLRDPFGPKTRLAAAPDAWLGLYRTSNARNFLNGLVPGFPQDNSPLGTSQPWYGLAAGSDGALATDGVHFYGAGLFFNRGGKSMVGAFRLTAFNDESAHPIRWDSSYSRIIDQGSMSATGNFADLPSIVTDGPRGSATECGNVYIAYTRFAGAPVGNSFIYFSRSTDCGRTYSKPVKISGEYKRTQRVVIAIDPRTGTPTTGGGGTLYAVFRAFQPDQFFFTKSTNYGATWTYPASISLASGPGTLCTYDQPTVGTLESTDSNNYTARALAFASVQVDGNGQVHVVWTERVGPAGSPLSGNSCSATPLKQPKIVYTKSANKGATWSGRFAIDTGNRCETEAYLSQAAGLDVSAAGGGGCPGHTTSRLSGPQVQPTLSYNAGKLMLMYREGREIQNTSGTFVGFLGTSGYHGGINTQMDVRVAEIRPSDAVLLSTTQVSRYAVAAADNNLVAVGNSPAYKAYNRSYLLQYKGGKVPFMGDHDGLVPMEHFVWDSPPHFAQPGDVPGARFLAMWGGDNREALFPGGIITGDWWNYQTPGTGSTASCNAGIRNSNNYAAYVGPPIEAFVHQSFKPPLAVTGENKRRTWVITVRNHTDTLRYLKYGIQETGSGNNASFEQLVNGNSDVNEIGNQAFDPFCSGGTYPTCTAYRTIQPYSSMTFTVFGELSDTTVAAPFKIRVSETTLVSGAMFNETLAAIVRLNPSPTNPAPLAGLNITTKETHGPSVVGPFVSTHTNPTQGNPTQGNPTQGNPTQGNPTQGNPTQGNPTQGNAGFGEYTEYRYVVSATDANTISGYSSFANIPSNVDGSHLVQMIITRRHTVPTLGPDCKLIERIEDEVISTITASSVSQLSPTQGNPTQGNPTQGNPTQGNPTQGNPTQGNPTQGNNTYALSPAVTTASAMFAAAAAPDGLAATSSSDGTVVGDPEPDAVHVTFRFFHCTNIGGCSLTLPGVPGPLSFAPETPTTEVVPKTCASNPCGANEAGGSFIGTTTQTEAGDNNNGIVTPPVVVLLGPDLYVSAPVPMTVTPNTIVAGDPVQLPPFSVSNGGDVLAGPSSYRVLLVPASGGGAGTWLTSSVPLGSLAANGGSTGPLTVPNIPTAALLPGTYLVGPYVDDQNLVGESNESNNFASATLVVVPPPAVTTVSLTDAVVTQPYSAPLVAAYGIPSYTWSVTSGRLPPGLSLDPATGQVSGTPVSSGKTHMFTVQAVDSRGHVTPPKALSIRVTGASFTVLNTDYAWGGVGAIFGSGSGTITIPSVSGITKALLYWQGPTTSIDPDINATVSFNGTTIIGTNIGFTEQDCWGAQVLPGVINCQAYRAEVTGLVSALQTSYPFTNFRKPGVALPQGISLLVFYNDSDSANNKDVYLFDGADSNMASEFDGSGWNMIMTPLNFPVGRAATLQLHVAGGQDETQNQNFVPPDDGELVLNGTTLVPAGPIFQGDSVPPFNVSGLWDIRDFDITNFASPGTTTLTLTSPVKADCSSLVVAAVVIQPAALPDLIVETLTRYPTNPTNLDLITVTATVRNIGQGQAGASTLELCVGDELQLGTCLHTAVPVLQANAGFTYSREVTLAAANYTNTATADHLLAVPESNEENTVATPPYSVIQATGRTLSGTIWYSINGLPGATVELVQYPNPPIRRTTTNADGSFEFLGLAAGDYGAPLTGPNSTYVNGVQYGATISAADVSVNWDLPKIIAGLSPASGETVSATPTLSWTANPEATYYLIEIFQMPSFTRVVYAPNVPSASYTVLTALGTGTYQWHVGAYRPGHNVGENSLTPTFVVPVQDNFASIMSGAPSQLAEVPSAVDGAARSLKDVTQRRER
jgi:hypothetical protein